MRPRASAISRYHDGVERLARAVEDAARPERGRALRISAGLASHLSHRVLAGERLPEDHDILLVFLLNPFQRARPSRPGAA